MELNYSLTENDYLQQQLYILSKKQIKKGRKLGGIHIAVILLFIGFLFYMNKSLFVAYCFAGAAIVCFFLFPLFLKIFYQYAFKKYIRENFKSRIGGISKIIFKEEVLEASREGIGKSELNFSVFENISEVEDYFFITFKTGENLMISKTEIEDIEALRVKLKAIAEKMNIEFISELDWKWI